MNKNFSILGRRSSQSKPANYAGVGKAPVWEEADAHATVEPCVLIADVVRVFNPQSPQARAIFDLAIVVIVVMVVIFAVVVGIARQTAGLPDSLLLATAAPHSVISLLTAVHQKNSNETATKGELNEMKSRIGTRDDSVAATCGQSAAGRREWKASR